MGGAYGVAGGCLPFFGGLWRRPLLDSSPPARADFNIFSAFYALCAVACADLLRDLIVRTFPRRCHRLMVSWPQRPG